MKKTIFLMAMLLTMAGSAFADNKLTVGDVTIKAGETAEMTVSMENDFTVKAYNFVVVLPEGVAPYYDEEEDDYVAELSGRHAKGHTLTLLPSGEFTNGWMVGVASSNPKQSMKENSGEVLTLTLKAEATAVNGVHECKLAKIWFAESGDAGVSVDDVVFSMEVTGGTDGINAVEAANGQQKVYNLAGQRVMNAQKGLYIMNGKKVVK